jgi:hypothetical protein
MTRRLDISLSFSLSSNFMHENTEYIGKRDTIVHLFSSILDQREPGPREFNLSAG